jgi:integrase
MALTKLAVDNAKPCGKRYELPDSGSRGIPGFALRVGETGVRSYVLRYRVAGRQRRVTIGLATVLTLAEARERARKIVDQARKGVDPAQEMRERQRDTVAAVAKEYIDRHVRPNLKSVRQTERRLNSDVVKAWGDRPISSITRRDVVALVDRIHDRAPVSANRTLQLLHRFFAWALKREILEANPAAGVDLPHKEWSRKRTLSEDELRRVWRAFEGMGWPWGDFGRLVILSGARRSEWAEAHWSEIDFESALWRLPPARSKTGEGRELPLVPAMLGILEAAPRVGGETLIFPSSRAGRPISGFSKALRRVHDASGTSGWHWHDCRRTLRTNLGRVGVLPHIGERVLGHAFGKQIERVYDLHRYSAQVREALLLWSADLERIVGGGGASKVVPIRR